MQLFNQIIALSKNFIYNKTMTLILPRLLEKEISAKLEANKVIVIYGPRQAGKTTLINLILKKQKKEYLFVSGEDRDIQTWLSSQSIAVLKENIGNKKLLIIDEAQKVDQIGLNLKLIVDHIPGIKVIATGSSSFELANQVGEPLVGRKHQLILYTMSQAELNHIEDKYQTKAALSNRLIYGAYPKILTTDGFSEKQELLRNIVDSYLYKDILTLEGIKKSAKIVDLLRLLAFQIGNEVSLHELGQQIHLDLRTIDKYLDLLEKAFVIKRISAFSRTPRKEISKNQKVYFFDNGIRNTLINNYNSIEMRNDIGALWENYLVMERLKKQSYLKIFANNYFWRTYTKKEIDWVEEREGKLFGYEFKWGNKSTKAPKDWLNTYQNANFEIINQTNYLAFIA